MTVTPIAAQADLAEFLGVTQNVLAAARARLADRSSRFLVVSGKMGSGKDTVAPLLLAELGHPVAEHQYYALPLKNQTDDIFAFLRSGFSVEEFPALMARDRSAAAAALCREFDLPLPAAEFFAGDVLDEVRADPTLHSRSRADIVRLVLQYLGTDVRRAQDPNYWVKLALRPAIEQIADGASVYFTDARFPNEVSVATSLGALTVRLDVSPMVQLSRLSARDGLTEVPVDRLLHESELALDYYTGFDIRINNDGALEQTLATLVSAETQMQAA